MEPPCDAHQAHHAVVSLDIRDAADSQQAMPLMWLVLGRNDADESPAPRPGKGRVRDSELANKNIKHIENQHKAHINNPPPPAPMYCPSYLNGIPSQKPRHFQQQLDKS
ncbi:hypothetical protein D9756_004375 [Leucocoprinus leucothites]|uniref:Uncharacterized protein n=1 Tax=Leucocoprinus leucothites TaxID=201217 RepID=A0A8H5FZY8_9AGAR|nr:hypothetical protein D9756_004375 [Leucoagaricus leucothites]